MYSNSSKVLTPTERSDHVKKNLKKYTRLKEAAVLCYDDCDVAAVVVLLSAEEGKNSHQFCFVFCPLYLKNLDSGSTLPPPPSIAHITYTVILQNLNHLWNWAVFGGDIIVGGGVFAAFLRRFCGVLAALLRLWRQKISYYLLGLTKLRVTRALLAITLINLG